MFGQGNPAYAGDDHRSIPLYRTNDQRAELKRRINVLLGSAILEEKSYATPS